MADFGTKYSTEVFILHCLVGNILTVFVERYAIDTYGYFPLIAIITIAVATAYMWLRKAMKNYFTETSQFCNCEVSVSKLLK